MADMGGIREPECDHDKVDEALLDAARVVMVDRQETGMPLKAILIYEYMDDDGGRNVSWRSVDMLTVDRMGFAQALLMGEQAAYVAGYGESG